MIVDVLLVVIGLINLVPGLVGLSLERARTAYAVDIDGPDLEVVMRHRAVLLALVGLAMVVAPWVPEIRGAALTGGIVSMAAFVVIAARTRGVGEKLRRVMWVDVVALVLAAVAAFILWTG